MTELANMKLHYKTLLAQDEPFVNRYGTDTEKETWRKGSDLIVNAVNVSVLRGVGDRMGKIRNEIHSRNEDNTEYRLFYLKHGPQTLENIRKELGSDIAEVVRNLRLQKD